MNDLIPGVVDLEQIGQGGQSTVYRGQQPEFGRPVAVKVFHSTVDDERTESRFRRECQAMGRFSEHPHVVTLYGSGVTSSRHPYLVMAYLPFGSLADRLAAEGPIPWPEATLIGRKLASAVHEAHGAGILHRDLKPANILLSSLGEPQLTDFGIVRIAGSDTASSAELVGTPGYLAPELFDGEPASVASDVYGLAATTHALIAGRGPFASQTGEALLATIERVRTEPPPNLRARAVPPSVADAIEHSLAKSPEKRAHSAAALAAELAAASSDTAMPAPRSTDRFTDRMVLPPPTPPPSLGDGSGAAPQSAGRSRGRIAALVLTPLAVVAVAIGLWIALDPTDATDDDDQASATTIPGVVPTTGPAPTTAVPTPTIVVATEPPTTTSTTEATLDPDIALNELRTADQQRVEREAMNQWVAQVSSKDVGTVWNDRIWDAQDILNEHLWWRSQEDAVLLYSSDDWGYRIEDMWVTAIPSFSSAESANRWCDDQNLPADDCFAKLIHTGPQFSGDVVYRG